MVLLGVPIAAVLLLTGGTAATRQEASMSIRSAHQWYRDIIGLDRIPPDMREPDAIPVPLPRDDMREDTLRTPSTTASFSLSDPTVPDTAHDAPSGREARHLSDDIDLDGLLDADLALAAFARDLSVVAPDDSIPFPVADSTDRVKFLPGRKRDYVRAQPFPDVHAPVYLAPSAGRGIQRIVKVDSMRNIVLIREVVNGIDVRVPYEMPLDEYIRLRYEFERTRRTSEFVGTAAEQKGDQLSQMIKNLTEFDIPIPPNPLMSIFGDRSRISLRISGTIDINAGFRIEKSDQESVFLNQTQFSPNFKQQVQVNVNGLIGDKLSIRADWSTERTFDYENQLKIKYTGYEDEIVQSIEAGNVSLQTPSQLVGGSGALFGIKAEFQFGPLRLSTVASQKKGESSKLNISGGATEQKFERHAYDYAENHYFMSLEYRDPIPGQPGQTNVYESFYNYRANGKTSPIVFPKLWVKDVEVWITRPATSGATVDPEERPGIAFIDMSALEYLNSDPYSQRMRDYMNPDSTFETRSGQVEVGMFKRLKNGLDYEYKKETGILSLNQNVQEDQVIAVAFRMDGETPSPEDDRMFGTFVGDQRFSRAYPEGARLVLKLIKPKNLTPAFKDAWRHRVRSIYSLNMRNLKKEDLANFGIYFREGGKPDQTILPIAGNPELLKLFGLDYTDDQGGQYDNKIDFMEGVTVNSVRGEIIFPTLEPWATGMQQLYQGNNADLTPYIFREVYDTTKTIARQSQHDKILIVGTTRGSSTASYYLGFNIVPGSVRVRLAGQPLVAGTDYTVDDISGQVRILKEEALVPGANVEIEYEKQDLFSFASKTLVGARGEMTLGKESFLGFTLLTLNQKTLSDKVRIGEEPINNTMFGIDARTRLDLPFLTDALNTLPFMQTKEKSSLNLQGEFAMMMPNPNTKISSIPTDEGKGLAYIDDFEGSRVFIPLQTAYSVWKISSIPALLPPLGTSTDSATNGHRARLDWYNIPISASSTRSVVVNDIWPNKRAAREDQRVTVLDLDFDPGIRGMFNYHRDLANRNQSWNGIMRTLPVNATNLVDGNYNYLEIWMKVETQNPRGKMLIDIGKVSEDVIPNRQLNSEDVVVPGSIRNGILNPGEDVGLDMLTNDEERAAYAAEIAAGLVDGDDPSGDDYAYNVTDWTRFNGTQGNINDPAGQFPDTEDLNNNGTLDLTNDYFQYEINLDTTTFALSPNRNPYVVGGGTNGWYQFRIPLANVVRTVGSPALDNVEFIRVILTDMDDRSSIRIAEFNFVGNQWYERNREDSTFHVSVVNIEDNPEYDSPPGVIRPRDRTRPDQEVYGNEQSLSLDFRSLPDTTLREAYRLFPGTGVDLFNYETLKMYVHGDPYLDSSRYELVMRFGIDSLAYYEYRSAIFPGWDARNEVNINFSTLTAVKTSRDSCLESDDFPIPGSPSNAVFKVKGCPDIISVRYMSIGIRNKKLLGPITGQIWINELRVIGPNNKNGYAFMGSANLRLADFADINLNVNHSDPFFHGLADRFSMSRAWSTTWNMSTTLNIDKTLPKEWQGTQIKVSYSHTENLVKPLLMPGQPDVEVEGAASLLAERLRRDGATQQTIDDEVAKLRIASQTLEIRDSWTIPTLRLKVPGTNWLVEDFINRLELSYNYSIVRFRDPTILRRRTWQWTAHAGYSYEFGRNVYLQPFKALFDGIFLLEFYKDLKIYYLPNRFSTAANLIRERTEEIQRFPALDRPYIRRFVHDRSVSLGYTLTENGLLNLNGSYSASIQTTLTGLETNFVYDENGNIVTDAYNIPILQQRQSSEIFSDIFFGRGSLYFGVPSQYQQQFSVNSRPLIPRFFDIDKFFDLTGGYQVTYGWQENLQQAGLGRTASFNSGINLALNVRLKAFFDPLFETRDEPEDGSGGGVQSRAPGGRRRADVAIDEAKAGLMKKREELTKLKHSMAQSNPEMLKSIEKELQKSQEELDRAIGIKATGDSLMAAGDSLGLPEDTVVIRSRGPSIGKILGTAAYYLIKVPFLDYDNINISFNETNASTVGGVRGQTGFITFWSTNPFNAYSDPDLGPSRMYQLGLVTDPNPASGRIDFKRTFPFIGIDGYQRGLRISNPNGAFADNFQQSNTVSLKTGRPLWEGAQLDLSWDLRWSVNKNYQIAVDSLGRQTILTSTTNGQLERSFLMFPDFLFFGFFKTNVASVSRRYTELLNAEGDTRKSTELLAQAFEEGMEAIPWLSRLLAGFLPRVNYGLRWDGLEKLPLLGFADRISLEHRYSSTLSMSYRHSQDDGSVMTESKRAGFNFAPLIGLTLNFNKLWGGDLSVNSRWGKQSSFDLNTASSNLVEQSTDEITLNASFKKSGFEFPLFGLALKNDIDFIFAFSLNKTNSRTYEVLATSLDPEGQPREGTTKITIEPRVRYVVSQRVQASIFYRYQRTKPDSSVGSRIPGTTIHEGGLELRISITGS